MTDKRTIDRRGSNHKQRTTYLLEDWLKDPAWSGGTQLGRGTLVHDSKSRERSTWAPRSWMTTAVVFLYSGGDQRLCLSLCVVSNRPDKFVVSMETSGLPGGLSEA